MSAGLVQSLFCRIRLQSLSFFLGPPFLSTAILRSIIKSFSVTSSLNVEYVLQADLPLISSLSSIIYFFFSHVRLSVNSPYF